MIGLPSPARLPTAADADAAERTLAELPRAVTGDPAVAALVRAAAGNSPFLAHALVRQPEILVHMAEHGPNATLTRSARDVAAAIPLPTPEFMRVLRQQKLGAATTIALGDIAGMPSQQVVSCLSAFADATIAAVVEHLLQEQVRAGHLAAAPSGYVVFAMGKLGAGELNYSSDVDLIALWDQDALELGSASSAADVFVPLTRAMVRQLTERAEDGYVFRTDLRLRPDPGATPVAMSFAAAEAYYENVGQNWERAAWIKARPVAGDIAAGERFLATLRPYVWRKHLDFAAIADIHSIKRQIHAHKGHGEVTVRGHNLKLGAGGIREIEFFAQTLQLIAGGRDANLRKRATTAALAALAAAQRISADAKQELEAAYWFLRRIEHRLQMVNDEQTHSLPQDAEAFRRIALFSGWDDETAFEQDVRAHLLKVSHHSGLLFQSAPALSGGGSLVFTGFEDDPETIKTLTRLGFQEPSKAAAIVRAWHHGRIAATRTERARELLTAIMPALLNAFGRTPHPDFAFLRFDEFLGHLPAGVQLFAMLHAHPEMLDLLAEIMGAAPRLAETLARRPDVLDAVLSPAFFRRLPSKATLRTKLATALDDATFIEDVLDRTRRFAGECKFQVGVQVMRGRADARAAGWMLSDLADVVVEAVLERAAAEFARQHGTVAGGSFGVMALGKLGAREMTAASDLDLVFLYDAPDVQSDGRTPLPAQTYYMRLSQRLIAALTAPTATGRLYEVDMRLRPSGTQGPIASSLAGFLRYQEKEAWLFEHMALTRGRYVAGSPELGARVTADLHSILARRRDPARVLADVADLRRKVDAQHSTRDPWRVKYVRGGTLDLEFLAQALALQTAADRPEVLQGDTAAAFDALGKAGVLAQDVAGWLSRAVLLQRTVHGWLRACLIDDLDPEQAPPALMAAMAKAAGASSGKQLAAELVQTQAWVYQQFRTRIEAPAAAAAQTGS
ncbi:MAG: bifunctional [glutamine synthetase] adenylyltransferase/[glutamine synthetase]-adenylyl-L-tyrosine phosphorylase [Alphaproteobacteria bacterium]|nr:bifunctional [glutamine synthetase] adenylyltransferase/[glutamine synthetase]-adenylyl-L-tyrosine phosphorylase [Alphaproteobacteria bacterium]